jgi:hypothetical protein
VNPVRAAALHEAVYLVAALVGRPGEPHPGMRSRHPLDLTEEIADRFEVYLAGDKEADA